GRVGETNFANNSHSQTISVTPNKVNQTITFDSLANKNLGDPPFTVSASASSGLPVTFSSRTPNTCTVAGNLVTLVAAGTCTIRTAQAGGSLHQSRPKCGPQLHHPELGATGS